MFSLGLYLHPRDNCVEKGKPSNQSFKTVGFKRNPLYGLGQAFNAVARREDDNITYDVLGKVWVCGSFCLNHNKGRTT